MLARLPPGALCKENTWCQTSTRLPTVEGQAWHERTKEEAQRWVMHTSYEWLLLLPRHWLEAAEQSARRCSTPAARTLRTRARGEFRLYPLPLAVNPVGAGRCPKGQPCAVAKTHGPNPRLHSICTSLSLCAQLRRPAPRWLQRSPKLAPAVPYPRQGGQTAPITNFGGEGRRSSCSA